MRKKKKMKKEIEVKIELTPEEFNALTGSFNDFHLERTFGYFKEDFLNIKEGIFPRIKYFDVPSDDYAHDTATVDGHKVLTKNANFFETAKPSPTPITTEEILVGILNDYRQRLNIADAEKKAQASRKVLTPQELKQSLDAFVKK